MTAKGDWLNGDGYPTEACLDRVRAWDPLDFNGLAHFLCDIWYWPELIKFGPAKDGNRQQVRMSTGGWSGNEDLIEAIPPQWHGMHFRSHHRGGHWVFEGLSVEAGDATAALTGSGPPAVSPGAPPKPELPPAKMMYEGGEVVNPKPELPTVRVIKDGHMKPKQRLPDGPPVTMYREGGDKMFGFIPTGKWLDRAEAAALVLFVIASLAAIFGYAKYMNTRANLDNATEAAALCDDLIPECARILAGETPCKADLFECVDLAILQEQALQDISYRYGWRLLPEAP